MGAGAPSLAPKREMMLAAGIGDAVSATLRKVYEGAPTCSECGMLMVPNGGCFKCENCGSTSGCS